MYTIPRKVVRSFYTVHNYSRSKQIQTVCTLAFVKKFTRKTIHEHAVFKYAIRVQGMRETPAIREHVKAISRIDVRAGHPVGFLIHISIWERVSSRKRYSNNAGRPRARSDFFSVFTRSNSFGIVPTVFFPYRAYSIYVPVVLIVNVVLLY